MENNILEVNVYDTITTHDILEDALALITKIIEEWFNSSDDKPLTITLSKKENKSPPVLGINVNDSVGVKGGLA